jgi:hypothetical protein
MSKKFFAKYSAVEGEIKEGDLYLQNLVGIGFINEIRTYTGGKLEARDKKVKLFLCSRDIEVGDKYFLENGSSKEYTAEMSDWTIDGKIVPTPSWSIWSMPIFKIIGEILTPGIVENQEFTEKETEYLTIGK